MSEQDALQQFLAAAKESYAEHSSAIASQLCMTLEMHAGARLSAIASEVKACASIDCLLHSTDTPVLKHLARCAPQLSWRYPGFGKIPAQIAERMAVVEIIGPDGMLFEQQLRFGLLYQEQNSYYPKHQHAAEELYCVLSGTALWAVDDAAPSPRLAGEFIHHKEHQPHRMQTTDEPLLAMWVWTGDIDGKHYAI